MIKGSLLFILFAALSVQAFSQTITTLSPTQTSTCAGGNIIVQYETTGTFDLMCTFTAQLSDDWGDFTNAVPIGSVPVNTGVIFGTIPSNTTFGIGYRVRVVSSSPYVVGTENPFPPIVITSSAVSASIFTDPGNEVCDGDTITLSVLPNESYIWSTGETTQEIDVTQGGTYTVTVTNYLTGCEVAAPPIDVFIDPLPDIDLGPDLDKCDGFGVLLDAGAGYSHYEWNDGTDTTQQLYVTQTGTYNILVTDTNGCINGDTLDISYHPNPQINLGTDTILCSNEYVLSVPNSFSSYNWNNGLSFNPSIDVTQSGTYHVIVENQYNCFGYDTISVQLFPVPDIELGNDVYACEPPVILNAGNGFSGYSWNSGDGNSQYYYVQLSGVQNVTVTDINGCSASDSLYVGIFGIPQIDIGQLIIADSDDTLTLDAGPGMLHYNWSTGDTTQIITIYAADNVAGIYFYSVIVTGEYGCTSSDEVTVQILEPGYVYNSVLSDIHVYPNPFSDFVYIDVPGKYTAEICSISGKTLSAFNVENGINTIPVNNISAGFYFVKIYDNGKLVYTYKMTKTSR